MLSLPCTAYDRILLCLFLVFLTLFWPFLSFQIHPRRAVQDPAQAFQCGQSDIFIFPQAVQRFIINPAFDQLVLRDVLFFHGCP